MEVADNPNPSTVVNIELLSVNSVGLTNGATKDQQKTYVLSAHNVNYTVQESESCCCGKVDKHILSNITGVFKEGITAIIGPTSSGKSTLLDVLACRKDPSGMSGQVLLNGKPVPGNFKYIVGYVVQEDAIMGTLSVKENIHFSGSLRLPTRVSVHEREQRVDSVIKELGLNKCADAKVIDISAGERKRCSIGMELIISPPILFLDEPIFGLDENMANIVLLYLKRLSSRGQTIIIAIHQAKHSIYRLFDNLMLLSGGHTVYHGPSSEAVDFFATQGFRCQENNNPPDFFIDVINGDPNTFRDEEPNVDADFEDHESLHDKLTVGFKSSTWSQRLQIEAGSIFSEYEARGGLEAAQKNEVTGYASSVPRQFRIVLTRALKNHVRNSQTIILMVATPLVFAIIIGALFWQLKPDPISGFKSRGGVIFFFIVNQIFLSMATLAVFVNDKNLFIHENSRGFYRVSVYFVVKLFFDVIPLRTPPVIIVTCVTYFSVGMNPGVEHFFKFMLGLFCVALTASGWCFFVSSSIKIFPLAQLMMSLTLVLSVLFGGSLINLDTIGPWLHWAQYLSLIKYGMTILYINEFHGREFINNVTKFSMTGDEFLRRNSVEFGNDWDFWHNYMALAIYFSCLYTLAYIQLRRTKKTT